jgi:hypothetical protein
MPTVWRGNYVTEDPDAAAYLDAVEVADGQSLEPDTRTAVSNFVSGCKADGIWDAIKASCIMAGARTLAGALVPLVGTAPTNINFVEGDYNRTTGLVGDGSTKYLDSNRADNADPQDDAHQFIYVTEVDTGWTTAFGRTYIGAATAGFTSRRNIGPYSGQMYTSCRSAGAITGTGIGNSIGGMGASRSSSTGYDIRIAGGNDSRTVTSVTPGSSSIYILADNANGTTAYRSDGRISFYSIGESLDLALLDTRVSTLMTDLAAAIP